MKYYMYLFEAHTIQRYILGSGKLKDMVGASELLEYLLETPLNAALDELGLVEKHKEVGDYAFSRRGGAAFSLEFTDENKARSLHDLWELMVKGIAPGLSFNHTVSEAADLPTLAFQNARATMETLRNYHEAMLPVAGPLVRRSPRTGQPAIRQERPESEDPEWIDGATEKKRLFSDAGILDNKFRSKNDTETFAFPRDTDTEFPVDTTRYVGIIHADGNGLGNIVRDLAGALKDHPDEYASTFLSFSEGVNQATCAAAREALQPIISAEKDSGYEHLPFRPLVLGGDDLTVVVRADYALEYAQNFLELFEEKTAEFLSGDEKLKGIAAMPSGMTACAGVAFIKINQPFAMGYRLAESLCDHAKKTSRQVAEQTGQELMPSSLAFHRVTSSVIENYPALLPRELTAYDGETHYRMTLGAYGVGGHAASLPALSDLNALKILFNEPEMARGPLRHFVTLLHEGVPEAKKAYRRWQENMGKSDVLKGRYKEYEQLLDKLLLNHTDGAHESNKHAELPFVSFNEKVQWRSFLADLSNRMAVEGEAND